MHRKRGAERQAWNLTRLRRDADQVSRLLDDTYVPLDNNQAEPDPRMVKFHDKISGCFPASPPPTYATTRSYLQTAGKNDQNRLSVLQLFTPALDPTRTHADDLNSYYPFVGKNGQWFEFR